MHRHQQKYTQITKNQAGMTPIKECNKDSVIDLEDTEIYELRTSSIQSLSRVRHFATPWIAARQASLSITNSRSLPKLMSSESMMPSNHLILSHPLLLLPSIFPNIRVFSSESVLCIKWPKYWSFSFNPSNKYSGLISFRIDWFDLLAVQGLSRVSSNTREAQSGRRLLGTNGGSLWLWCCLAQPGALGPWFPPPSA